MASTATVTPFRTDVRFVFAGESLDAAAEEVQLLIEAAARLRLDDLDQIGRAQP